MHREFRRRGEEDSPAKTHVETEGTTVEEAVDRALAQLRLPKEKVDIKVIDEGTRGFLGMFGSRNARVFVSAKKRGGGGGSRGGRDGGGRSDRGRGSRGGRNERSRGGRNERSERSDRGGDRSRGGRNERGGDRSRGGRSRDRDRDRDRRPARTEAPRERARAEAQPEADPQAASKRAAEVMGKLIDQMGFDATVKPSVIDGQVHVEIDCADREGLLIGRKGETLQALQHLVGRITSRQFKERSGITVDISGYRQRRTDSLEDRALELADEARRRGEATTEPMPASDRRIIHRALADVEDVETEALGSGPRKRMLVRAVEGAAAPSRDDDAPRARHDRESSSDGRDDRGDRDSRSDRDDRNDRDDRDGRSDRGSRRGGRGDARRGRRSSRDRDDRGRGERTRDRDHDRDRDREAAPAGAASESAESSSDATLATDVEPIDMLSAFNPKTEENESGDKRGLRRRHSRPVRNRL